MRPEAVPGLTKLTETIHAEGAAISAQIGHAGPVANSRTNKAPALAPVRFFNPLSMRFAKKASIDDIREVTEAHANAARLAIDSGFDAVEVHLGHNYLASSFLSPLINRRTDEFGGSLENRAKVARGVVRAVRDAVDKHGDKKIAVIAKLNMSDGVRGGIPIDESLQTAKWLEEDGGLDAIELTAGSSLVNPMYLFRGGAPVKEFAANFKPPISWGIRMSGNKFFREYPYHEAYLMRDAEKFARRAEHADHPAGRHHQPRDDGPGDGGGLRVRRDGPRAARRAGPAQPDPGRRRQAHGQGRVLSKCTTATCACRPSTATPTAW